MMARLNRNFKGGMIRGNETIHYAKGYNLVNVRVTIQTRPFFFWLQNSGNMGGGGGFRRKVKI